VRNSSHDSRNHLRSSFVGDRASFLPKEPLGFASMIRAKDLWGTGKKAAPVAEIEEEEEDELESDEDPEDVEEDDEDEGADAMEDINGTTDSKAIRPEDVEKDTVTDAKRGKSVQHEVTLSDYDATLDVIISRSGSLLTSLSKGGFKHLVSGVRANTGAKAGRYLFEVKVLEKLAASSSCTLQVGFSTAKSSLFLGDGTSDNFSFDGEGRFVRPAGDKILLPEGDEADVTCVCGETFSPLAVFCIKCGKVRPTSSNTLKKKGDPIGSWVLGIVLNLDAKSPCSNTVSVFRDGVRVGKPTLVPGHLHGQTLYPTISFKNLSLAVNFGQGKRQLRELPFTCDMFADIQAAHHESASYQRSIGGSKLEVVVPLGIPDQGFFDFVDRFLEDHPGFTEVSDRKLLEWCRKSGLVEKPRDPSVEDDASQTHCLDRPDFFFEEGAINGKAVRAMLRTIARLADRNLVFATLRSNLLRQERMALVSSFPSTFKKVAIAAIGPPSDEWRQRLRKKITDDYEAKIVEVEQRKNMAEAAGDELSEEDLKLPAKPVLGDSVCFMPKDSDGVADVAESLMNKFVRFTLPSAKEEGFDEVKFPWRNEPEATNHLREWIVARKSTTVVHGLKPSKWFENQLKAWQTVRVELRKRHAANSQRKQQALAVGDEWVDVASIIDLSIVEDVHDADGHGTPLYANFKYEDWIILAWRWELHLLTTAFAHDVKDTDRPGIPEEHVGHYYNLYFKLKYDTMKLGCQTLEQALKLLKEPLELVDKEGCKQRILRSTESAEATIGDFVKRAEKYRRDRRRRIEAGDESAQMNIPKAAPAKPAEGAQPPSTPAPKAMPQKGAGKGGKNGASAAGAAVAALARAQLAGSKRPLDAGEAASPPIAKRRPEGAGPIKSLITKAAPAKK